MKIGWKERSGVALFMGAHFAREMALVYQRYVFFGALGAAGFGVASVAVAPALFGASFVTMITGELVIVCRSRSCSLENRRDAVKYILCAEIAGLGLLSLMLLLVVMFLPSQFSQYRGPMLASVFILPASAFSQIAANWVLLSGGRSTYGKSFFIESALVFVGSKWLIDEVGLLAVPLAYCVRPLVLTIYIVGSLGGARVRKELHAVLVQGRAKGGREIHAQYAHQAGSLLIKSAWSSLDVMMVAGLAGERAAGHYRILKTLASVPSMLISPVWGWLRPEIAAAVRDSRFAELVRKVILYSLVLSLPAVLLLLVPSRFFDVVYHWVFPRDDLPPGVLKVSLVLWWLVASGAGWARSLSVASGRIDASTYGNIMVFCGTFLVGPALVVWTGFSPLYVVPASLCLVNIYWYFFLARFGREGERNSPAEFS